MHWNDGIMEYWSDEKCQIVDFGLMVVDLSITPNVV